MSDLKARLAHHPIAIIGMGAIFPEAHNLREYWSNIVEAVNCITDVPESRWRIDDYYDPDPTVPDKTYCKRGGFLPEIDFDPMEFGLPPNILEVTDVSQMLSLLVVKEALIDAGYLNAAEEIRNRTGVVLGVGGGQKLLTPLSTRLQYPVWEEALLSCGISQEDTQQIIEKIKLAYIRWEENSFPGMLGNVIAGRIANRFDLGGINCVTDAACAGSMAALRMAVNELTDYRADMMITGGVDTDNSINMYMCFSKTPAFTKGDQPRPFDAESDGMMVGEGIGMMILKRLEDAERDGDRIYAVIRGLGASSDGRFKSIYAPRGEGQEKALRRAYEDAEIEPSTVSLFEAHGTGTVAGDTTEVTTAVRYFNQHDPLKQHIALGSVKSQIGHAKAAAGIAGLVKAALALHQKVLPPTISVETPNPKFDLDTSAFYVNTQARPWHKAGDTPRRAGVSSFGFGGTNFHVVMEEYTSDHNNAYRLNATARTFIFHAPTPADLATQLRSAIDALNSPDKQSQFLNFAQQSQNVTIPAGSARLGFVAINAEEAAAMLDAASAQLAAKQDAEEWSHPKGIFYRRNSLQLGGRVVALFSGQGSQYLDMGREISLNFPEMRDTFQRIDTLFSSDGKTTLSDTVYPRRAFSDSEKQAQETALQNTLYAQPAIGAMSAGLFRILSRAGFRPDFTAGHSFGEVSALWAAGVINDADYDRLIRARGAAMARPDNDPNFDAGTMIAVSGDVNAIEQEAANLPGIHVANRNSSTQVVLAGAQDAVTSAEAALKAKGYRTVRLSVSAAFHTPLVGHAHKPFAQAISAANFSAPGTPVYSNTTANAYPSDPATIKQMLSDHMLQPVYFRDEIENLYAAGGYVFVEFGPRNVLTSFVKDILGNRPHIAISLNGSRQKDSDRQMREAFVQLQVLGLALNALDPYVSDPAPTENGGKKSMKVQLSGANYVSQKTRDAYRDALENGFKLSLPVAATPQPVVAQVTAVSSTSAAPVTAPAQTVGIQPAAPLNGNATADASEEPMRVMDTGHILNSLETTLAQFRQHQEEIRRAQEQFSHNQAEYFHIFFELMQQQQSLLASGSVSAPAIEAINGGLMRFHDHQSETLRLHESYLRDQNAAAQALLDLVRNQYAAMAANGNGSLGNGAGTGAVRANVPQPIPAPRPLSQPQQAAPQPVVAPVMTPPPAPIPAPAAVVTPAAQPVQLQPAPVKAVSAVPSVDVSALSNAMLRIVSDKTGYPMEMLELNMDMEADLGIDSIKRVEILGAMRDEFPALPQFSPDELAELRTLGEIVDYMRDAAGGSAAPMAAPIPVQVTAPVASTPAPAPTPTPVSAPQPVTVAAAPVSAPVATSGVDVAALSTAMLRIVSDKTGYPVDMLELSMDMEADLGIDSIKRVEILGAMRDEFPALPQFSPDELAELRTLGEIVDYMRDAAGGSAAPVAAPALVQVAASAPVITSAPAPTPLPVSQPVAAPMSAPASNSGVDVSALSNAMLRIVSDKTGYPADMLELSMDMEADLGIDSIKRVEILGAMRDEFPALPQFSPDELAELRTLGEIVDYMRDAAGGGAVPAATPAPVQVAASVTAPAPAPTPIPVSQPVAAPVSAPAASSGVDVAALSTAMLRIVSDKTGYPADMLELSMDMEADLGIDSIKRVEILGAMRDEFPALPQFSPDELAELRTLGEIVDYMRDAAGSAGSTVAANGAGGTSGAGSNAHHNGSDHTTNEVSAANFLAGNGFDTRGIIRSVVELKRLPQPDYMEFAPSGVTIVTDDGSPATSAVIQRLSQQGMTPVVLRLPSSLVQSASSVSANVAQVALTDTSEEAIKSAVATIAAQYGAIGGFIHLNPATTVQNGTLFFDHEKEIVKLIFLLAKYLKPHLTAQAPPGSRSNFLTVTRLDGAFGTQHDNGFGTIAGGLAGLVKTLNLEWTGVFCRAIDLIPNLSPEQTANTLFAELHDPNRLITEVGYGVHGRATLVARVLHTNGVN